MHVFVWVENADKMFLQILVERKFGSRIEGGEIYCVLHNSERNAVQPDGFSVSLCYRLVLASLFEQNYACW